MPKPMYVWTGTAWVSVASEVESLATYATQSYADNTPGTRMIVPTSISVGSGSGSVSNLGKITFSGASSVSINGCFSSIYDNYRIIIVGKNDTTDNDLSFRVRSGTTDLTASEYSFIRIYTPNGSGPTRNDNYSTNLINLGSFADNYAQLSIDICSPFLTQRIQGSAITYSDTGGGGQMETIGFGVKNNTSYDGFTIYPATSTMTGIARIYGYKNG